MGGGWNGYMVARLAGWLDERDEERCKGGTMTWNDTMRWWWDLDGWTKEVNRCKGGTNDEMRWWWDRSLTRCKQQLCQKMQCYLTVANSLSDFEVCSFRINIYISMMQVVYGVWELSWLSDLVCNQIANQMKYTYKLDINSFLTTYGIENVIKPIKVPE